MTILLSNKILVQTTTTAAASLPIVNFNDANRSTNVYNNLAAGYVAGVCGTVVGYPIDTMKVWMQTKATTSTATSRPGVDPSPPSALSTSSAAKAAVTTVPSCSSSSASRPFSTVTTQVLSNSSSYKRPLHAITGGVYSTAASVNFSPRHLQQKIRQLYAGVSVPIFTVGLIQSLNFAIYDTIRQYLHAHSNTAENFTRNTDALVNVGISGMTTGLFMSVLTNPLVLIKTQQQLYKNSATNGSSFLQTVQRIVYANGATGPNIRNLYYGYVPHSFNEVVGRGIYFVLYEHLKRSFSARNATAANGTNNIRVVDRMLSAGTAGIICWSIIFPIDTIRCKMFANAANTPKFSAFQTLQALVTTSSNRYTLRNLYRGYSITLLRAGPVAAFVLPIYDYTLEYLNC